jgi:hypothetical protein
LYRHLKAETLEARQRLGPEAADGGSVGVVEGDGWLWRSQSSEGVCRLAHEFSIRRGLKFELGLALFFRFLYDDPLCLEGELLLEILANDGVWESGVGITAQALG